MTFVAPAFLLLAGLAAVVWFLARPRYRRETVPSLALWRRIAAAHPVPRQRKWAPQQTLLTWVRIAAILAAALALARPIAGQWRAPEHWIVVLDASSAMHPADRFEAAKAALGERAETAGDRVGRMTFIVAGVAAEIPFARRGAAERPLAAALSEAALSDGPADWRGAAELAAAAHVPEEPTRLLLAGPAEVPPALTEALPGVAVVRADVPPPEGPDHAITATLVPDAEMLGVWHVSAEVAFRRGAEDTHVAILFQAEGAAGPVEWGTVPAEAPAKGTTRAVSAEIELPGPGLVTVQVPDDATPFDNAARFHLRAEPEPFRVLLIGPSDTDLARALSSLPGVEILHSEAMPASGDFDLVVAQDSALARDPGTSVLWIGTARREGDAAPQTMTDTTVVGWSAAHPLAEAIGWHHLQVGTAIAVEPWDDAETVLSAAGGPLIQARTTAQGREVRVAFSPGESNWSELASFPIFLSRLVGWTGGPGAGLLARVCTVGRPCDLPPRFAAGEVTLDGDREGLSPKMRARIAAQVQYSADGSFVPERAGTLSFASGGRTIERIVNPAPMLGEDVPSEVTTVPEPEPWPAPLWRYFAAAFLALALVHAVLIHRSAGAGRRALGAVVVATAVLAVTNAPIVWAEARHGVVLAAAGAASEASAGDGWGIVRLDAGPTLRRDLGADEMQGGADETARPGPGAATALRLAAAMLPEGDGGRIVVDGEPQLHVSALADALPELKRSGVAVDRFPFEPIEGDAVAVHALGADSPLYAGDSFVLTAIVESSGAREVQVEVRRAGEVLISRPADLPGGRSRIETTVRDVPEGTHLFEVALRYEEDNLPANNAAGVFVTVRPAGTVAVVGSNPRASAELAAALTARGLDARPMRPDRAPHYLADWLRYQAIVLDNVPAIELTTSQQTLIETAVEDHGLGLVILGGDRSFGPGGYLETSLDRLSPVSSRVEGEKPRVALAFVLDRSGSMQQPVGWGTRLDIAKSATLSAMDLLGRESEVAVVVFDEAARTVVPRRELGSDTAIADALALVSPGGGTAMLVGLSRAFDELVGADAAARHVIVLTDGLSQPGDFEGLIARMREADITVSSISIGQAPVPLVERIAEMGGGAFHRTSDVEALPSIMSQEAVLLSGAPVQRGRSQPVWLEREMRALDALPAEVPPIEGFVLTTAKPGATIAMATPDSDGRVMPLLAHWRRGNGTVVALTTQIAGPWTREWLAVPGYLDAWAGIVRQVLAPEASPDFSLTAVRYGDEVRVAVEVLGEDGRPLRDMPPEVTLEGREGAVQVRSTEARPGRYEATFAAAEPGGYVVSANLEDRKAEHGLWVRPDAGQSELGLERATSLLGSETGGSLRDPGDWSVPGGGPKWSLRPAGLWWMALALALLLLRVLLDPGVHAGRLGGVAGGTTKVPRSGG